MARRAGHSPEVIHRRYEGCIDGRGELNNKKIEKATGWGEGPEVDAQGVGPLGPDRPC